jgi:hypothetical protein
MTDDEFRDLFHRVELRFERLEAKVDNLDKGLAELRSDVRSLRDNLEARLDTKAGNWVVGLWGATVMGWVSLMVGTGVALLKLWP